MPQQKIILHPKGLYTNLNQLGVVPQGALSDTNNVILGRPGVLGVRRGRRTTSFFAKFGGNTWDIGATPLMLFNAKLRVGGTFSTNFLGTPTPGIISMMNDGTMYWSTDGKTFTQVNPTYGLSPIAMTPVTGDRHWYGFEQNGAIYITTANGVIVVARPLPNTPISQWKTPTLLTTEQQADWAKSGYSRAGVPFGINTAATIGTAAGTAIDANCQVAYRFCFGYRDANNNLMLGAPSSRVTVTNPSGGQTRDATVSTQIPPDIVPTRHFWQLYRSLKSSSQDTDPGDDLGLVAEGSIPSNVVADHISRTNGTVTATVAGGHGLPLTPPNTNPIVLTLKSTLTVSSGTPVRQYSVMNLTTGTAPTWRIYYRDGNAGAWTAGADISPVYINTQQQGNQIITVVDPITRNVWVVFQGTNQVFEFSSAGALVATHTVGNYCIDNAVYHSNSQTLAMITRPSAKANPGFDYTNPTDGNSSEWYMIHLNTGSKSVTYLQAGDTFPSIGRPYYAGSMNYSTKVGVWNYSSSVNDPYLCVAMPGQGANLKIAFCRGLTGKSWNVFSLPNSSNPANDSGQCSAVDTFTHPTTGETHCVFGYTISNTTQNWAVLRMFYIQSSDSINYPTLATSPYTLDGLPKYSYWAGLRINRTSGLIASVYALQDAGDPTIIVQDYGATRWLPSTVPNDNGTIGTVPLAPLSMTNNGIFPNVCVYDSSDTNADKSLINLSYNIAQGSKVATQWMYDTSNNLTQISAPTASSPLFGSRSAREANFAPATIKAGTYNILTVPNTTQFTFSAPQTPNVDVVNTAFTAIFSQSEIYYVDTTPSAFIGAYLYTSPSVEGITQANYQPPVCRDATLFRTTAFYANATQRTNVRVNMLKLPVNTDGTTPDGSRIYIGGNGTNYYVTAGTTEDPQNLIYKVTVPGPGITLTQAIRATINSIARVVNINWTLFRNLVYPIGLGVTSFSTFNVIGVTPADSVAFKCTAADGVTLKSTFSPNNFYGETIRERNVIYYSKTNQPSSVPLLNNLRIGSDSKEIIRILPCRDALFVFKEDGCFIVRGYGPPWQVDPYDLTLILTVPDSLVTLDNAVFGAFARGVFKVTDSNVELISLPIQNRLEGYLIGELNGQSVAYGFGVGDNPDHKYMLYLPYSGVDYCDIAYVFDTFTSEWTTWTNPCRHAISFDGGDYNETVPATGRDTSLYFAGQTDCYNNDNVNNAFGNFPSILKENKSLNDSDYFDDVAWKYPDASGDYKNSAPTLAYVTDYDSTARQITISGFGGSTQNIGKYDLVVPAGESASYVEAIMPVSDTNNPGVPFTILNPPVSWLSDGVQNTPVIIYRGILHSWKFAQAFPNTPAATNHFSELAVGFREAYFSQLETSFELPVEQQDPFQLPDLVNFNGVKHFGPQRRASKNNYIRTFIPRQSQRGTTLTAGINTGVCGVPFEVNGIFIIMTQGPTSFQRR